MENYEVAILVVLAVALLFFGFTLIGGSGGDAGGAVASGVQYAGGGCGR